MRGLHFLQTMRARLTLLNVALLALVLLFLSGVLRAADSANQIAAIDSDLTRRASFHKWFWANVPEKNHAPILKVDEKRPSGARKAPPKGALPAPRQAATTQQASTPPSLWRTPVIERTFELTGRQNWPPETPAPPWDRPAFQQAVAGREIFSTFFDGTERVRVLSIPLRHRSGEIAGVAQIGASLSQVDSSLASLTRTLLTLAPVALLISGMGGLLLTGWMHRPLRRMNQAIAQIGAEDLSQRLTVRGQDEFSILATNFNAMLSRLESSFEQQRRFTADASHELRTPLTVIKVYSSRGLADLESTEKQRQAWGATDRAATLMNAIVQDLLLLARSDAGQLTPHLQPVSVWAAMEAAIESVHAEDDAPIRNELPDTLQAQGDATYLTRVFTNLLKNALRHTPQEGAIAAWAERNSEGVVVVIRDTGTGIPPTDLPHVMERFYRVDAARSRAGGGTGLGLSICQSLMSAQGGHLEIESVLGKGTTVRVVLCPAETRSPSC